MAAGVVLAPGTGRAVTADMQFDYQQLRIFGRSIRPDGSVVDTAFARSFWVQTYRATAVRRLRPTLELLLQGEYARRDYLGGLDDHSETPYGLMRLSHPAFGVSASVKPARLVQQVLPLGAGGGFIDTASTSRLEYRTQETIVTGFVVPQRLPRVDVSWIRRQAEATGFTAGTAQEQRSARTSWGMGGVSLRAGYTDLAKGGEPSSIGAPIQRTYEAGAGFARGFGRKVSATAGYDFSRFDRDPPGSYQTRSDQHTVSLGGAYRQAPTFDWGLGYQLRYIAQNAFQKTLNRDHEGAVTATWHPRPTYGATFSSGLRTTRYSGSGRLQRYLSAQGNARGLLRRGWTVLANLGESVNWDPIYPTYLTTHARLGTQMHVRTGLDLAADYEATITNDTLSDRRVSNTWTVGVVATPWRAFNGRASVRESRSGSILGVSGASSRTWNLDGRWTPTRGIDILGAVNRTDAIGGTGAGTLAQTASVQWTASPRLQMSSTYSHTSTDIRNALVVAASGSEVVSVRADWALSRYGSVNAGVAYVDPGTSRETRQINASWNQRLWR